MFVSVCCVRVQQLPKTPHALAPPAQEFNELFGSLVIACIIDGVECLSGDPSVCFCVCGCVCLCVDLIEGTYARTI